MPSYPCACASSYVSLSRKNSSSEPIIGVNPSASARSTCARSTWRGDGATGEPSCQPTSQRTSAVASSQGIRRSVARSGWSAKSP